MIIKLTVNDNDFDYIFSGFFSNFFVNMHSTEHERKDIDDFYKLTETLRNERLINGILNPNMEKILTREEEKILIKRVETIFEDYIKYEIKEDDEIIRYLMEQLEVDILDSFTDNGKMQRLITGVNIQVK